MIVTEEDIQHWKELGLKLEQARVDTSLGEVIQWFKLLTWYHELGQRMINDNKTP